MRGEDDVDVALRPRITKFEEIKLTLKLRSLLRIGRVSEFDIEGAQSSSS